MGPLGAAGEGQHGGHHDHAHDHLHQPGPQVRDLMGPSHKILILQIVIIQNLSLTHHFHITDKIFITCSN